MKSYYANLSHWIEKALPIHHEQGRKWYFAAHDIIQALAQEHSVSQVSGAMAALSPQVSWPINIVACVSLVETGKVMNYTGYKTNVDKAKACLSSHDPLEILGGLKVRAFYDNLYRPYESLAATVDTHMVRASLNTLNPSNQQINYHFSKVGNALVQDALQRVAQDHKILPHMAQATIWLAVKHELLPFMQRNQLQLYNK